MALLYDGDKDEAARTAKLLHWNLVRAAAAAGPEAATTTPGAARRRSGGAAADENTV